MTFVDSSAFVGMLSAEDESHQSASRIWQALMRGAQPLLTTNYVVVETCAVLQRRLGMDAVKVFLRQILPAVELHWVTEQKQETAFAALIAANRRKLSLVDCVSFVVMRELRVRSAFAFDDHFREEGFDCDLA